MQKYAVQFLMTLGVSSSAPAAVITWGAVQDTTSSAANDLVDGGAVDLAINGQSQSNTSPLRQGSVTLDGILFASPDAQDFWGNIATPTLNALSLPSGRTTGDADYDTFLTHVAIPEPSSFAFLALGMTVAIGRRRSSQTHVDWLTVD
ncbi:MAG: PEP-CTERM sorting domain-containing protein [Phycisphaera sp. RhM]|nr:PEP-CTERM sorting domain-containing protein [Phycisphaera sp. RhM]